MARVSPDIDRWFPPHGPCLICGIPGADARHRVIDAIVEHTLAGETAEEIARELEVPVEGVRAVVDTRNTHACPACGRPPPTRTTILRYVRRHPGTHPRDIAIDTGLDYALVRKMVRRMTAAGQLRNPGPRAGYHPPEG